MGRGDNGLRILVGCFDVDELSSSRRNTTLTLPTLIARKKPRTLGGAAIVQEAVRLEEIRPRRQRLLIPRAFPRSSGLAKQGSSRPALPLGFSRRRVDLAEFGSRRIRPPRWPLRIRGGQRVARDSVTTPWSGASPSPRPSVPSPTRDSGSGGGGRLLGLGWYCQSSEKWGCIRAGSVLHHRMLTRC